MNENYFNNVLGKIKSKFFNELDKKPSWDKEEIKELYSEVIVKVVSDEIVERLEEVKNSLNKIREVIND